MRRHEREITSQAELNAVLQAATVVELAMVDEGSPYVVPMSFGFADGCLYLHCAKQGRKIDILRRNPQVCFNLFCDDAIIRGPAPAGCNITSRYRSITGEGRAEFIEGDDAKRKALDIILAHYASGPFVYDLAILERTCVFRVVVESMTGKKAHL
jgi:nitroimidazol reductase NimA-like FMN-containing flavoprotein (pyridoxamine 5'-phosphate oxidase superfamily)